MAIEHSLAEKLNIAVGAGRDYMRLHIDGSTATAALTAPVPTATVAATWLDLDGYRAARIMFGGTNAANQTINYQVIVWRKISVGGVENYIPSVVASGAATLGAKVYTTTGFGAAGNLFADTITNTLAMPGVQVYSPADDTIAELIVDTSDAAYILVETDLGTAASADVLIQKGSSEQVSEGTVTEANSASIKALMDTTGVKILPADVTSLKAVTEASAANILTALQASSGNGLTVSRVVINQTAGAGVTALKAALASNYTRLHALFGTMEAAGTLTLEDSDGTDVSGPMPIAANGGFALIFGMHRDICPITAVGKGLSINTSQKFYGLAVVSQSTTA